MKNLMDMACNALTHDKQVDNSLDISKGYKIQTALVCIIAERQETAPAGSD